MLKFCCQSNSWIKDVGNLKSWHHILKSGFCKAKNLNSPFWKAKILYSAKIFKSGVWKAKILNRGFWNARIFFSYPIQLYWTYTRTVNIHKRQSATKRKLQLEVDKKKPNTIQTQVVTEIKWERNQLSKQNFIPYLKETKKQTILFWNLFRDQSYKKYIFLD